MKKTMWRWLELAQEDLDAVELLNREVPGIAVYHLHQAAAKLLKALLEDEFDAPPPRTYNLAQLSDSLPADSLFKHEFKRFAYLAPVVAAWCYPRLEKSAPELPDADAIEAIRLELADLRLLIQECLEVANSGILPGED